MEKKSIAVIASRLKCVDAVSVEAERWIDKYSKLGYKVHLISGKFGEPVELPHFELPEMDYKHPEVRGVKNIVFSAKLNKDGKKAAEILLNNLVKRIKGPLKNYLVQNKIQVLSIEDALISLKNLPLSIAMSQIASELSLPTISRYHYLPWANPYFTKHENFSKILADLPPRDKNIVHVTNTESARKQLNDAKKIQSRVIPNTIDVEKLHKIDEYNSDFRKAFGIRDDQIIFLQPTRVKRNKFVERSIKLVAEINDITKKDNVLLITGSPVYSRGNYFEEIIKRKDKQKVQVIFANDRIFLGRHQNPEQKFYSIHDAYVHSDIVLYPNIGDAFGNPIIEAAAYRKPVIVDSFPNLCEFSGKGFRFVKMDQKVDAEVVSDTYELIANKAKADETVETNFELLKKHYSSDVLDDSLIPILNSFDDQPGFMARMANMLPPFWKRSQEPNKKESFKTKQQPSQQGGRQARHAKKESPDLRNRKGSYKEPQNK
jgi:glycosyltransferase involved in cell wall biosynthesis